MRIVVDLGLRQVERVGPLDRARGDIVGDQEADNLCLGVEDEGELGLGDVPARVRSDAQRCARRGDAARSGLEKQLGALGLGSKRLDIGYDGLVEAVHRP